MGKKWFLKVWIFSLMCMAAAGLVDTCAFGQISQDISVSAGNLFNSYNLDSSLFVGPLVQSSSYSSTVTSPFNSYSLDSSLFVSPVVQSSSYNSTVTNPLATISNQSSSYTDLFSTSWNQSANYQNAFGFGYSAGSNLSHDLFSTAGGQYVNIMAPGSLYSSEHDYSNSIWGGSNHSENTLILPWTTYSSDIATSYGMDAWPYLTTFSGSSVALGTPTVFSGFGRYGEGIANLVSYAPISAQLDQILGNQPMYTPEGMPFYATASFFNPYNPSNYYFAPGVKTVAGGLTPAGIAGSSSWVTGSAAGGIGLPVAAGYPGVGAVGYPGVGAGGFRGVGGGGAAIGGGIGGVGGIGGGSPVAGGVSPGTFSAIIP